MNMWTAIALIAIAGVVARYFQHRASLGGGKEVAHRLEEMDARIDALEKDLRNRVETLERIVTNPKENLKRQFENLEKVS